MLIWRREPNAMLPKLCLFLTIITIVAAPASSQTSSRDLQRESIIWEQLKAIAPETIDDFKAATVAMDSGNYDEAVRLYQAVNKKAPDYDPVMRRLGWSLVLQGKVPEGLDLLEKAVAKNRSAENLLALASCLAYPGENKSGTKEQKWRAYSLILGTDQLPKMRNVSHYQSLL